MHAVRACFVGGWVGVCDADASLCPPPPSFSLQLNAEGTFIGDLCTELTAAATPPSAIVVLLGDDRGLTEAEEGTVKTLASQRGTAIRRVSLGADVLFASHSIVLVHHYLDRYLHSCHVRPPRVLVRGAGGGGRGAGTRGRGRGGKG